MQLLSQKEKDNNKISNERETKDRIRKLGNEEVKAVNTFNELKIELEKKTSKIRTDFDSFEKDVTTKKRKLDNEVTRLENRRTEALKPIKAEQELINKRNIELDSKEEDLKQGLLELENDKQDALDMKEEYIDRKQVLDERESSLNKRERGIIVTEEKLRTMSMDLITKQTVLANDVTTFNVDYMNKSKELNKIDKENKEKSDILQKKEKELNDKEILLKDRFKSLAITIGKKKLTK